LVNYTYVAVKRGEAEMKDSEKRYLLVHSEVVEEAIRVLGVDNIEVFGIFKHEGITIKQEPKI